MRAQLDGPRCPRPPVLKSLPLTSLQSRQSTAYCRHSHSDPVGRAPVWASDEGMDARIGVVTNPGTEIPPDSGGESLRVARCAWLAGHSYSYLKVRSSGDLCPSPSPHTAPCRRPVADPNRLRSSDKGDASPLWLDPLQGQKRTSAASPCLPGGVESERVTQNFEGPRGHLSTALS